ncbi:hypothetical protein ACIPJS_22490 [Streptomyces sp. NPDC086783]|uniref:hypothetical protein n=1 Tax=Streptomyces sp. NPDC086783 TaxID=3365758 RepID=UPI0038215C50
MVLFLLLVLAAVILGIIGVAAAGLGYLLFIGIAVFVLALVLAAARLSGRTKRRTLR